MAPIGLLAPRWRGSN
ncbi:hypothetical protein [Caulobacter segnis]|nr:hypothetical protein [Caulobacter segnis]